MQALTESTTSPGAELGRIHVSLDAEHGRSRGVRVCGDGGVDWCLVGLGFVLVFVVECWATVTAGWGPTTWIGSCDSESCGLTEGIYRGGTSVSASGRWS